jgi:hypothetical protein
VRKADAAALLVPARILRRVIKRDRGLTFVGWSVTRRQTYVIAREPLRSMVAEDELVLWPESAWPPVAILLLRPDPQDLAAKPPDVVLLEYWRMLFHAEVELAFRRRFADQGFAGGGLRERIAAIGALAFEEIRTVLRQDGRLLPPRDDETVYTEFAALFLELRHFAPALLPHVFPAVEDQGAIDELLAEDVDATGLLEASRLAGAPDPREMPAPKADTDETFSAVSARPPRRGARAARRLFRWLIVDAERSGARGNVVRAAIDRARAGLLVGPVLAVQANVGARNELDRLVSRLQAALGLDESQAAAWRQALPPLLERAIHGFWALEGRLLYDLQSVCVDHEREVFTVDLVEWVASGCRRPLRRALPHLREVLISNHMRRALRRLRSARLPSVDRAQLADLIHPAVRDAEEALRDRLRPLIIGVLCTTRILPHNMPETVAYHKLIEELLDRIVARGFLSLGDLRDACSRSNLKLPDLSGPGEFFRGNRLLQTDRALAQELEGVYRRGEVYLRWLQRLSALAFSTAPGRFLTKFGALPYGGAFVALAGLQHYVEPIAHRLAGHEVELVNWVSVPVLGTIASGLINFSKFRRLFLRWMRIVGRALRLILIELPARLLRLPLLRRMLDSPIALALWRVLVKPLLFAVPIGMLGSAAGMPRSETVGAIAIAYIPVMIVINSRVGRDAEEIVAERAVRLWRELFLDVIPGVFRLILSTFSRILEAVDRLLYAVDEWLRFRAGQHPAALVAKAVLGLGWFFVAYLVRVLVNVLVEPQVNPIKHFPVVTVSHKLILPLSYPLTLLLKATPLGPKLAPLVAGTIVVLVPGVFGFLVWELKENWRLYEANRAESLRPVIVSDHGETMARLLRPGIHSGTLPKLFAKLRRAERRTPDHADQKGAFKRLEALHHVEESVRRFIERDLIALLDQSRSLRHQAIEVGEIHLATNRIRIELHTRGPLLLAPGPDPGLWIVLALRHDALIAAIEGPGWLPGLSQEQTRVLTMAIIGVFKMCGIEWVRGEPDGQSHTSGHRPALATVPGTGRVALVEGLDEPFPRDRSAPVHTPVRDSGALAGTALYPFTSVVVTWRRWVEAWKREQAGAKHPARFLDGYSILPRSRP